MGNDWHNDLIPLVCGVAGLLLAFKVKRLPAVAKVSLAAQALPVVGIFLSRGIC